MYDWAVSMGRQLAEDRMTSQAAIRRKTDQKTTNADGFEVPVWQTTYTDLPMRLAGTTRGQSPARRVTDGPVEYETAVRVAHLPTSTSNLRDGDLIEITSGENAGLVLRIVEAAFQDQATARRVPVTETLRPEEWT